MNEKFKLIGEEKIPCGYKKIYESDMFRYDCEFFTGSCFYVLHKETNRVLYTDGFRMSIDASVEDALLRIEREVIRKFFF